MSSLISLLLFFFFFNDTATTEIYTLSLHDALPIWCHSRPRSASRMPPLIHDLDGSLHGVRSRKLVRSLSGRDPQRSHRGTSSYDSVHLSHARSDNSFLLLEPGGDEALQHVTLRDNVRQQRGHDGHGGGGHQRTPVRPALEADELLHAHRQRAHVFVVGDQQRPEVLIPRVDEEEH